METTCGMIETGSEMPETTVGAHEDFAGSSGTVKMSKILAIEIKGTLSGFSAMGPTAATWKPVDGKHMNIFGIDDGFSGASTGSAAGDMHGSGPGGADVAGNGNMVLNSSLDAAMTSLKNATITKATILQSHNTFPVPLGVTVNCLPCNEVCDTGDKYTFTTIPNTSVNVPIKLYEAGQCQTQAAEWRYVCPCVRCL